MMVMVKKTSFLVLLMAAICCLSAMALPSAKGSHRPSRSSLRPSLNIIPNAYIVSFKPGVTDEQVEAHWNWLLTQVALIQANAVEDDQTQQSAAATDFNIFQVVHKYNMPSFKGYSIKLPDWMVPLFKVRDDVEAIEPDTIRHVEYEPGTTGEGIVNAADVQGNPGSWGIRRISVRNLPIPANYSYPQSAGEGVDVYVIDTGIDVHHPEFQGRAKWGKTFAEDGDFDGNGHGTHCSGTIGSKTYGVAKKAHLIAVKVLSAQGSGSTSDVIAGIEYTITSAKASGRKSVASMSLGGGASIALDRAVKAATKSGIVFAVAAGNSGGDACKLSPARVPEAITVAASDIEDRLAYFSEKGRCVNIIAPGVNIKSTWIEGKVNTISGTSMATPHVAGVAALALAEDSFIKPSEVITYLQEVSSKNHIRGKLDGAPNDFLYNNVHGYPDDEPKNPKPDPGPPKRPRPPKQPIPKPPPKDGECPFPSCLFDPACTSCCVDC